MGVGFFDACCCNKLIFSCPREGVIGLSFSAFAIAVEMIPELSSLPKLSVNIKRGLRLLGGKLT